MTPADALRRAIADAETLAADLRATLAALEPDAGMAPMAREAEDSDELVPLADAARSLGLDYDALRIKAGRGKFKKKWGRAAYITRAKLFELAAAGSVRSVRSVAEQAKTEE